MKNYPNNHENDNSCAKGTIFFFQILKNSKSVILNMQLFKIFDILLNIL